MTDLRIEVIDQISTITLSRPASLNALNLRMMEDLRGVLQKLYHNDDIKGIILTGEGERSFVAGADIKEFTSLNPSQALEFARKGQHLFQMIADCPKPVIAAVNGFALGGGCELAMACHIRIATENAKFGQPEITLGIIPGYGGTQRLSQLVGRGKALELMLTADKISAQEAKSLGLVNHVVSNRDDLMSLANSIMRKIIAHGAVAVAGIIKSINAGYAFENAGFDVEAENFAACSATADFKEGTEAFIQKRKPSFKGK